MNKISHGKIRTLRRERNAEVLRRLKNGEVLSSFNSYASWYPPRPIIKKSQDDIAKLYGDNTHSPSIESPESEKQDMEVARPLRLA